jgi:hypothetical protein
MKKACRKSAIPIKNQKKQGEIRNPPHDPSKAIKGFAMGSLFLGPVPLQLDK